MDLKDERNVSPGTQIRVELFNLNNPIAGNYVIDVTTIGKKSNVLEVIPSIAYSTFASSGAGDITAVNTPAGSGLTGGAVSGDVTLSLQVCAAGQVLKSLGSSWACAADNDTNSGGTITGVTAGTGLAGGGTTGNVTLSNTGVLSVTGGTGISITGSSGNFTITNTGDTNTADDITSLTAGTGISITGSGNSRTVTNTGDTNPADDITALFGQDGITISGSGNSRTIGRDVSVIQSRVSGICAPGSSIRQINTDGTVACEVDDSGSGGVTSVTATAPLASSGGTTPNISLPNVIIGPSNTAIGSTALDSNTSGFNNTASGALALTSNTTGLSNTASGLNALLSNTTGANNTAIGTGADVTTGNLTNATAIGAAAIVDASNKIRLGDANVAVIEAQVALTAVSDKTKKENFQPVDGEEVLKKIQGFTLTSWNFIGHDPKQFRHYGPVAQDFFAAFGNDGLGTIGTPTTINSGDMAGVLMIAVQALEKQNREIKGENADLKVRLDALEQLLKNKPYVTTAWAEPLE